MFYLVSGILIGSFLIAIGQLILMRQLTRLYTREKDPPPTRKLSPKVAIVLSLRGHDPYLTICLRNLIRQQYPNFLIHVVIDSPSDPAWKAIREVQAEGDEGRLSVSLLRCRSTACSLKNSAIIQAIDGLPEDCELVAFVDADAITAPTWLSDLVAPLADPDVACTTGIRWFAPTDPGFASRLRSYWNWLAAAMIYQGQIPWGGSMVVRRSVLDAGLTAAWSHMFCEDAYTIAYLRQHGLKLVCVPQATVVNEESTSLAGCLKFVNRQMLIFRLYHRGWWFVAPAITVGAVLRGLQACVAALAFLQADYVSLLLLIAIHPLIMVVMTHEGRRLDRAVQALVSRTGREIAHNPLPSFFDYFCTELMVLGSVIHAFSARQVQWRGISYRIHGPHKITMLGYQPFADVVGREVVSKATVL